MTKYNVTVELSDGRSEYFCAVPEIQDGERYLSIIDYNGGVHNFAHSNIKKFKHESYQD